MKAIINIGQVSELIGVLSVHRHPVGPDLNLLTNHNTMTDLEARKRITALMPTFPTIDINLQAAAIAAYVAGHSAGYEEGFHRASEIALNSIRSGSPVPTSSLGSTDNAGDADCDNTESE